MKASPTWCRRRSNGISWPTDCTGAVGRLHKQTQKTPSTTPSATVKATSAAQPLPEARLDRHRSRSRQEGVRHRGAGFAQGGRVHGLLRDLHRSQPAADQRHRRRRARSAARRRASGRPSPRAPTRPHGYCWTISTSSSTCSAASAGRSMTSNGCGATPAATKFPQPAPRWRRSLVSSPRAVRQAVDALLAVALAPACAACGEILESPLAGAVCPSCWLAVRLGQPAGPAVRASTMWPPTTAARCETSSTRSSTSSGRSLARPLGAAAGGGGRRGAARCRVRRAGAAAPVEAPDARLQPGRRPGGGAGPAAGACAVARRDGPGPRWACRPRSGGATCAARLPRHRGCASGSVPRSSPGRSWCWWTTCARPAPPCRSARRC